jgi:rfaE bifunctional protein nucleotidyltransferase chain/domain
MQKKIVYTAGVWDLFHHGHLNILNNSKKLGDILVVGVLTDEGAAAYKRKPIQDQATRMAAIRSIQCVDSAVFQSDTDPTPQLEMIRPHIFTHGDDWKRLIRGQETLDRLGIEFVLLPYTKGISTTELIKKMNSEI